MPGRDVITGPEGEDNINPLVEGLPGAPKKTDKPKPDMLSGDGWSEEDPTKGKFFDTREEWALRQEMRRLPTATSDIILKMFEEINVLPKGPDKEKKMVQLKNLAREFVAKHNGGNIKMAKPEIVKEGQLGRRNLGSFMESFVLKAQEVLLGMKKTAAVKSVVNFPDKMEVKQAKELGFFKQAKSCGFGAYAMEPLDGGLGSVWFTEKGEDGKDYLAKQMSPEGDVVRRFKEKQASLKKADAPTMTERDLRCSKCNRKAYKNDHYETICMNCDMPQAECLCAPEGPKEQEEEALSLMASKKGVTKEAQGGVGKDYPGSAQEVVPESQRKQGDVEKEYADAYNAFSQLSTAEQNQIKNEYMKNEANESLESAIASSDDDVIIQEAVTPPGFEHAVREMKKEPEIDNPWALCLEPNTLISMCSGEDKKIKDIRPGEEIWAINPIQGIVATTVNKVWQSGQNIIVISVRLDNGAEIICTETHPFMMRDGSFRFAKDLSEGDSLMPLYKSITKKGYIMMYDPIMDKQRWAHRIVAGEPKRGSLVHHRNFNPVDNSSKNLEIMSTSNHSILHRKDIHRFTKEESARGGKTTGHINLANAWKNPTPKMLNTVKNNGLKCGNTTGKEALIKYNKSEKGRIKSKETLIAWNKSQRHGDIVSESNKNRTRNVQAVLNHKVASVSVLGVSDVYDIQCDLPQEWSNFGLSAGVFVHNSWYMKNKGDVPGGKKE